MPSPHPSQRRACAWKRLSGCLLFVDAGVLNCMLKIEQHSRLGTRVTLVDEYRASTQQVAVAFVTRSSVASRSGWPGQTKAASACPCGAMRDFSNTMRSYRGRTASRMPISRSRLRTGAGTWRHFEASRLALSHDATEPLKRFKKEGFDIVGLKSPRLRALHVLTNTEDTAGVHGVMGEGMLLEQVSVALAVERVRNDPIKPRAYFRLIAVADGFD